MAEIYRRSEMLKTFLVEDEVVIREMIKKMIPWAVSYTHLFSKDFF